MSNVSVIARRIAICISTPILKKPWTVRPRTNGYAGRLEINGCEGTRNERLQCMQEGLTQQGWQVKGAKTLMEYEKSGVVYINEHIRDFQAFLISPLSKAHFGSINR